MIYLTVPQIQALDRWAIETLGIPSLVLMENAGRAIAEIILKKLRSQKNSSVVIVCGTGNNGGDGLVAARYLLNAGLKPVVFIVGDPDGLKADALVNYKIAQKLGIRIKAIHGLNTSFKKAVQSADLIVDAIFGFGLNRPIEKPLDDIIQIINMSKAYVLAVDIPSGLDGTTGSVYGVCVKADLTATFSYPKKGFIKKQGPLHAGQVMVIDIGIPRN